MRLPFPRSLAAQLAILLVLAVMAAQIPAAVVFTSRMTPLGQAAFTRRVGDRMVLLSRMLRTVPPELAPRVVAGFEDVGYRFSIDAASAVDDGPKSKDEAIYQTFLKRRFGPHEGPVRVHFGARDPSVVAPGGAPDVLMVSLRLADGRWLNGATFFTREVPPWLRNFATSFAASVVGILVVIALGLSRIVGPVTALARAAERAGRGEPAQPLPERGPRELRTMTGSFNLMQERLRAANEDRARMLAAISHDLRTPIASLRLRAEMVEEHDLREAMVRTLGDMRQMAEDVLSLARQDATDADSVPLDLAETARAVVEDHRSLGRDVTLSGPDRLPFRGKAQILRRALDNLVDNAVRYGQRARVRLIDWPQSVEILVDDDGPGVPPERIEEMFMPFTRLEGSRSADTGGAGLGLAIVRYSVRVHGGDVTLHNLPGQGLRAAILVPKEMARRRDGSDARRLAGGGAA